MRITRRELYEQVWSEPMSHLARRYGLSDVGLSKTCLRLGIPVPPRGHWAKLQHGKPSPRVVLPPPTPGQLEEIQFHPVPRPAARTAPDSKVALEALPENKVVVPAKLSSPHPAVQATAVALSGVEPDDYGMVWPRFGQAGGRGPAPLDIRVSRAMQPRALRLADALLKALEARGYRLDPEAKRNPRHGGRGEAPAVIVEGEKVPFAISEKADRTEHIPTATELAELKRYSWHRIPKWDYTPGGKLTIQINVVVFWADGIRKRWSDGRGRAVEDSLNDVIASMIEIAAAERQHRDKEAREKAERQDLLRRKAEEEHQRKIEEARRTGLVERAEAWSRAETTRRFVAEVRRRMEEAGPSHTEALRWLAWAEAQIERIDPLSRGLEALLRDHEADARKAAEMQKTPFQRYGEG